MATFNFKNIKIAGIACAVPNNKVETTSFYPKLGKKYVDDFISMAGVRSTYRTSEKQTASDLCFVAAKKLLEAKNIQPDDIGILVFISQTPDYKGIPATACVLHKRLNLPKSCMAFDVTLGCSGYVYGLDIAGSLLQTLQGTQQVSTASTTSNNTSNKINSDKKALLLFGDTNVKVNSPEDKSVAMLFGEAGSATLLVKEDKVQNRVQNNVQEAGRKITDREAGFSGELMTDGEGFKAVIIPAGGQRNPDGEHERTLWGDGNIRSDFEAYINGTDVFSFTITEVPKLIKGFMQRNRKTVDDYDAFVLHQANLYILKQIAKKIKVSMEKIPISIDRYGNTSGTSIPLTLCDSFSSFTSLAPPPQQTVQQIQQLQQNVDAEHTQPTDTSNRENSMINVLMSGFGVGLSWGVVSATIDRNDILPIIYTDDYYTEGSVSHD